MFKLQNLTNYTTGKAGKCPISYSYWNQDDDTDATLKEAGYFENSSGLRNGDQIAIISADYKTIKNGYVLKSVDNVITFDYSL